MIQRIQTLFLALVAASMVGVVALPLWHKTSVDGTQTASLSALELVHKQGVSSVVTPVWYIAVLAVLVAVLAIYAIFQYRNRVRQALFCAINSLLMTAITGLTMYFIFGKAKNFFDPEQNGQTDLGFYALLAALISNFLANRFIRRDEKFVKSQERMR
jgi:glucan phosphoethanolaminetransferase (alkaline phosphatase superfamily)